MKHARSDYDRIQDPEGLIPADEPVLLIRGQDKHIQQMIKFYQFLVSQDLESDQRIINTLDPHIDLCDDWQRYVKVKAPDLP